MTRWTLLLVLLAPGCVIHGQRNAPGIAKIEDPPLAHAVHCVKTETPFDPGERVFTVSTGVAFGGGSGISRADDVQGLYQLSVETSLHLGYRRFSHRDDPPLLPMVHEKYWPDVSVALNLGWHLLQRESEGAGLGAGYAELQAFSLKLFGSGVAAGWAYDPVEKIHGPQFTIFTWGALFARVSHMIDRGTDLLFGIQFKVPVSYMWSR